MGQHVHLHSLLLLLPWRRCNDGGVLHSLAAHRSRGDSPFPSRYEPVQTLQSEVVSTISCLIWYRVLLGAGIFTFGCVYLCSFFKNPLLFIYCYSIAFGIGKGLMYSTALQAAISHLPGRKGAVSGFVICGFGFGGFFFGIISKHLCNPNDMRPVLLPTSLGNERLFLAEVASRVPTMIRTLNLIWIGLWLFGLCTITRY